MGWFSKVTKKIKKTFKSGSSKDKLKTLALTGIADPITASPVLQTARPIERGKKKMAGGEGAASQEGADVGTGRVDEDEAQDIVRRRLSNVGRVYTSPTGVGMTEGAQTGRRKVFS